MSIKEELAFIDNIEEFPAIPSEVLTLMSDLSDPDTTLPKLEGLINMDPELGSYILKLTNSPIFDFSEEVFTVSRAIVLLGMSNLRSLMASYSIRLLCNVITNSHAREYIWSHSLAVAVITKVISEKLYGDEQPDAYIFGLLHDIGKIVLYIHNGKNFQEALEQGIMKGMDFVSAENKVFGFSHIEAGYLLINKLGFSRKTKDIVLFHHNPEFAAEGDKMPWIVSLANELAHHLYDNKVFDLKHYLEQIQIPQETFNDMVQNAQKQVEQYRSLL
jgi:putative nucleotidyltransferase with HDIG domain